MDALAEIGLVSLSSTSGVDLVGFPHVIPTISGQPLCFDLKSPSLVGELNPDEVGIAILDLLGFVINRWGLATKIPFFNEPTTLLETPISSLIEGGFEGRHASLYYRGARYFSSHVSDGVVPHIVVLVVNAKEEAEVRRQSAERLRMAETLRRLGKALTMNQNCEPLCVAAVHEIASSADLAAAMLWVMNSDLNCLDLMATVGINRKGIQSMQTLKPDASGCFAEIAASTGTPVLIKSVSDHILSDQFEASACYLRPQGLYCYPLEISGKLIGVLELLGKVGDRSFAEKEELFETLGEHLALAINGSLAFENLHRLASQDALTGLSNHRSMQETLHQMVLESERSNECLSALMIDVDHFHFFNEEEGHDAGDEILKNLSDVLRYSTRDADLVARYGGEEFVVLMPRIGLDEAAAVAERIRLRVAASAYQTKCGRDLHVTVSVGCACIPESANEGAALLRAADMALYEAKKAGRNRVCAFDGATAIEERRSNFQIDRLQSWFSPSDWEAARLRLEGMMPEINRFASKLSLNASQRLILQGLVLIAPTYREALFHRDETLIQKMARAEEFRLLMPSLSQMSARHDGLDLSKPDSRRVPLLTRVLQVILALEEGQDLTAIHGGFDPKMVEIALSLESAA